ncbi:MAG TPA: OmpA family protein [Flavitalea sp.]|nr:OmpA family protein [Flavitalea sp.]
MQKTATWLTIFLCITCNAYSQKIALIIGPSGSKVNEKNALQNWDSTTAPHYSGRTGLHIGILAEVPVLEAKHLFFQTGILYQSKGRKYFQLFDTVTAAKTDTFMSRKTSQLNYMEFPLNLAWKVRIGNQSNFVLTAGPYFAFFYNGKEKSETRLYASNDYKEDENTYRTGSQMYAVKTMDFGFNTRIGIETRTITFSAFMSRGVSNFYHSVYGGTFHHAVNGISIGFWLNRSNPVGRSMKIKDSDKDGIVDELDECPEMTGSANANGCPDIDGDGIADKDDKCVEIPGLLKYQGCPVPDLDKDGIADEEDQCPTLAGKEKYHGCPLPDTDNDGINDEIDLCPDKAGETEFNGCPIPDTDGDGINDKEDKCPTEAGIRSNNGCPEIQQAIIDKVNLAAREIFFTATSDKITARSLPALHDVIVILNENPDLKLEIEGHSDNTGSLSHNLQLSEKRAQSVKKYLVSKGIQVNRLNAQGFGQDKPIDTNSTEEGRSKNRRVALKLIKL